MERIIFLIGFLSSCISASTDPPENISVKCLQKFVPEGGRVDCDCKTDNDDAVWSNFLSWPGYSNNSKLNVWNVTRADNGTVFTCMLTWGGHKLTTNYTLRVAYGPDDKHTRIEGPVSFITDGTKILQLKCVATEVYPPPPHFVWDGVTCLNDKSDLGFCDIKPQPPWDDDRYAYCSARNSDDSFTGNTTYKLNLTYPPVRNPEILGYTSGQVLRNGDELHCRVSGGKPLVKEVNFSCSSEIPHQDQEDITDGSSVRSSVTIDINERINLSMVCVCGAIWEPSEDLYRKISSVTVFVNNDVQDEETYFDKIRIKIAVAVTAALLIAITIGIVTSILVKKKRTHEESCQQTNGHRKARLDYEEVDEPWQQQECGADHIQRNNSESVHGVLDEKKEFPQENITRKGSRQRDYFPLSSKTLESEIADSFKEGNNSPKKVQLGGDIGDGLYTDIDIPSQEQDMKYDNWTLFSERKDMTDTASSTSRARDHKKPCNYDNAVLPQSSIPSPAQDEPVFKTEDCELYDTLQRR